MRYLIILLVSIVSCSESVKKSPKPIRTVEMVTTNSTVESKPFANPALIHGSSFGAFFQTLYRVNQFDLMLDFTVAASRKKFGNKALLAFYRNNFKLDFVLGDLTAIEKSADTCFLVFAKASIIARRKVVIPVLIENDSCKIIIHSLKNPFN